MSEVKPKKVAAKKPAVPRKPRAKKTEPSKEELILACKNEYESIQKDMNDIKAEYEKIKPMGLTIVAEIIEDELGQLAEEADQVLEKQKDLETPVISE